MTVVLRHFKRSRDRVSARRLTELQDEAAQETRSRTELALIRECDDALDRMLKLSRRKTRISPRRKPSGLGRRTDEGDVRSLEQMVARIASTDAASDAERMAKVAVYREYASFDSKRPNLLAIMLQRCSEEMEGELLRRARYEIGDV